MKTLLILRHAKSSWKNIYLADHDRPLNTRGKRDAPRMGRLLAREQLLPDLVISSTAERARETTEIVTDELGYEGDIEYTRDFYHADPEDYVERLRRLPDECQHVLIVGHNPGMAELVLDLTGEDEIFPTAALAEVELDIARWAELDLDESGRLRNLWRPKEVDL